MADTVLPAALSRNICNKAYEKRKLAAQDVEKITHEFLEGDRQEDIRTLIEALTNLASNTNSSSRSGGLMGIASVAVVLGYEAIGDHLDALILPAMVRCEDQDSRVRFFACEALYNIVKVARETALRTHFPALFDTLARMAAEKEPSVRRAATVLDRLIKDVVLEDDGFDVDAFVAVLADRAGVDSTPLRRFLLSWVTAILTGTMPIVSAIPVILDALLRMIDGDGGDEDSLIPALDVAVAELMKHTIDCLEDTNADAVVGVLRKWLGTNSSQPVLVERTLDWSQALLSRRVADGHIALFLRSALELCASPLAHVSTLSASIIGFINETLSTDSAVFDAHLDAICGVLKDACESEEPATRVSAMLCLRGLLAASPSPTVKAAEAAKLDVEAMLVTGTLDTDEEASSVALTTLGTFLTQPALAQRLDPVVNQLVAAWDAQWSAATVRMPTMFRALAGTVGPAEFVGALARHTQAATTHMPQLVERASLLLLTADELAPLRRAIAGGSGLYPVLVESWARCPTAVASIALLARQYGTALDALLEVPSDDLQSLVTLDKIVQLLESPIYTHVRLDMTRVESNKELSRVLLTAAALLPIGSAGKVLTERLTHIQTVTMLTTLELLQKNVSLSEK
ncbi:Vacuolar 14 Fab1-binding region [Carpediemonas membranifera]|uniref:Vacuolar 14 Fab1-binding region n=1 Tax=Carpediemonas membranifera TaxID=201153 RepID=A0A8J6AT88_9EUKA|nr:Vacuolar 14 Fab1-binding region [Carpediemonas membranifera]|eukprot:KAG9393976.1 Vacuolar 14 Fab1-binding region [Carpediemonas membranifera]